MKSSKRALLPRLFAPVVAAAIIGSPAAAWAADLITELDIQPTAAPGEEVSVVVAVTANATPAEYVMAAVYVNGSATIVDWSPICVMDGGLSCDLGDEVAAGNTVLIEITLRIHDDAFIGSEVGIEASASTYDETNPSDNVVYGFLQVESDPVEIGCYDDSDCYDDSRCEAGECVPDGEPTETECYPECPGGYVCDAGECIDEALVSTESEGCSIAASGARGWATLGPLALALLGLCRRRRAR